MTIGAPQLFSAEFSTQPQTDDLLCGKDSVQPRCFSPTDSASHRRPQCFRDGLSGALCAEPPPPRRRVCIAPFPQQAQHESGADLVRSRPSGPGPEDERWAIAATTSVKDDAAKKKKAGPRWYVLGHGRASHASLRIAVSSVARSAFERYWSDTCHSLPDYGYVRPCRHVGRLLGSPLCRNPNRPGPMLDAMLGMVKGMATHGKVRWFSVLAPSGRASG